MKMIIGGAFQGKLAYGNMLYPDISWLDGSLCDFEAINDGQGIFHFPEYIHRMMEAEREEALLMMIGQLPEFNPELVVIAEEIGYGLVPVDSFDRRYREMAGRICTRIAAYSDRVDRVICGIGTVIKGGGN